MPRNRFVSPETLKLPLTDDDWLLVKKRLNYSEELRLQTAGITGVDARALAGQNGSLEAPREHEARINWEAHALERIALYVVDWSFVDETGKQRKLTREAIKALDLDTAQEIADALDAHIAAMEAEKATDPTRSTPGTKSSS